MAGLYGVKRFRDQGLRVLGIEAAPDVGGVWYHNAYPGARVDVESLYYCYFFDPELYLEWHWSEKYATQPELLSYFKHVADRHQLRNKFLFDTRVVGARWCPDFSYWRVTTHHGESFTARYLIMATGQLSKSKEPPFDGLDDFEGEWAQTSAWQPVEITNRHVAVVGTGSSGVQAATAISKVAAHTYVLQRTPGYVIPIPNGPSDQLGHSKIAEAVGDTWKALTNSVTGIPDMQRLGRAQDFTAQEQLAILEERWGKSQFGIFAAFSDTATDLAANDVLATFVRQKIREQVNDPNVAEELLQKDYPIGARRLIFADGYYQSFNRDNVTLVNISDDPIDRIIPDGIRLVSGREIVLNTIVFAIGFEAFTGAIEAARIRNEHGAGPTDHWGRGPQTYLGLMTRGFPNLFIVQGPGSPSTLSSNMNLSAVCTLDFVGELIAFSEARGKTRIEPSQVAVEEWTAHVNEVAEHLLRRQDNNYMVHVNDDGSRVLIPYAGGVGEYNRRCAAVAADGFRGFELSGAEKATPVMSNHVDRHYK